MSELYNVEPHIALCITKQLVAKLTSFGFPTSPKDVTKVWRLEPLTKTVYVYWVEGLTGGDVWALVVHKGHTPLDILQESYHVVDFRVGDNLYEA